MNPTTEQGLRALAGYLTEHGFDSIGEAVTEYLDNPAERAEWRTASSFLGAARGAVWYGFRHVGDESERPVYEAAAAEIDKLVGVL